MIDEIQKHFKEQYPKEACGVIGIVKGKKRFYPCENVAEGNEDFIMSSTDYMKYKRSMDIVGIVHNHPDSDNTPSQGDIDNCNAVGIPYYIFSYPKMELNILEPKVNVNPLVGREYKFGSADCFEGRGLAPAPFISTPSILIGTAKYSFNGYTPLLTVF